MKPLRIGKTVSYCVNDCWLSALVVRRGRPPRSYIVDAANGMHYRRNRQHLRKRPLRLASPEIDDKFSSLYTLMNNYPLACHSFAVTIMIYGILVPNNHFMKLVALPNRNRHTYNTLYSFSLSVCYVITVYLFYFIYFQEDDVVYALVRTTCDVISPDYVV